MPTEWAETIRAARAASAVGFDDTEKLAAMLLDQAWHTTPADQLPTDPAEVEAFEQTRPGRRGRRRSRWCRRATARPTSATSSVAATPRPTTPTSGREIMDADTVAWFGDHGGLSREAGRAVPSTDCSVAVARSTPWRSYRDFRGADPDLSHLLERMGIAG